MKLVNLRGLLMNSQRFRVTAGIVVAALLALSFGLASPVAAQGGVLSYGENAFGSLSAEAPLGFYSFAGTAGDLVMIQVLGASPGMNPAITLLDSTQQTLASNSNDPFGFGDGTEARISYRLEADGLYTILVSNANGAPGDYLIRLRGTPASAATGIDQDTPATADVAPGTSAQVFSVSANPAAATTLRVSTSTPDFEFSVQIRDTSGALLAVLSGSPIQPASFVVPAGDGVFEIRVVGASPTVPGVVILALGTGPSDTSATTTDAPTPPPAVTESAADDSAEPTSASSTADCSVSSSTNVNLRSGPGTNFEIVGSLTAGITLPVLGRSIDGVWYVVNLNGQIGWVFGPVVGLEGTCGTLPVVEPGAESAIEASTPTATVSATSTSTGTVTATSTATSTVQTGQVTATPTASATSTTTTQTDQVVQATPTSTFTLTLPPPTSTLAPTATYTPSYTPTTPPAAQIAPEDARFNNPLTIPLDNTASVLDFVSYPDGDNEDRVRWDITGMNQNSSLSGGRARLVIQASCFGENTDQIQFFTGGQTYACGQTLVDREVTANSRTGSMIITAVGGEGTYVQWVLTGTATRIN
jgi:uncharacterized protein YraI